MCSTASWSFIPDNDNIWYAQVFGDGSNSSTWTAVPGNFTNRPVSVAQMGPNSNNLYMVYRGLGNDLRVWGTWFDGQTGSRKHAPFRRLRQWEHGGQYSRRPGNLEFANSMASGTSRASGTSTPSSKLHFPHRSKSRRTGTTYMHLPTLRVVVFGG